MIISASVRTDIPAFYGEWFRNRLRAGYCRYVNPYNSEQQPTVWFDREGPDKVDGFVFWTKNLIPFLPVLPEVRERGFPFMVQYTINGYPRELESRVVDAEASVRTLRLVAEEYGKDVPVWRYDTVVFSSLTPYKFHVENFQRLARALEGATNEVVTSFVQMYKKTRTNIAAAEREHGFRLHDEPAEQKQELLRFMVEVAGQHGMTVTLCSQPELQVEGVHLAHCVDRERMERISGQKLKTKVDGMRENCLCYASRDIGDYDTCPHGCVYCYAVQNRPLALERFQKHDPTKDFLIMPAKEQPMKERQPSLFDPGSE